MNNFQMPKNENGFINVADVFHIDQVSDGDLIDYWLGKVMVAYREGNEALRTTLTSFFDAIWDDVDMRSYTEGKRVGKMDAEAALKMKPSRSKIVKAGRKTKTAKRAVKKTKTVRKNVKK